MTITYRRRQNRNVWHFSPKCRWWPKTNYQPRKDKPKSGEFCDQCKAKRANKNRR